MTKRKVFISFPLSEELDQRVSNFVANVRESEDKRAYSGELVDLVESLVNEGLEHFFWTPVEITKLGGVTRKMIRMGINSGKKTLNVIAGKVIKGFTDDQIEAVTGFLESLLLETE